jgi:branched-chain amino acid transport system permease protein
MLKKIPRQNLIFFGGALLIFVVVQLAISFGLLNDFWNTILRVGAVMAIVSLGLNLIYGFNGQFSLGQWGFYAIGAYTAADITYRWINDKSAIGLSIALIGVLLVGAAIIYIRRILSRIRGLDALSAFTIYFVASLGLGILSVFLGRLIGPGLTGLFHLLPDPISLQLVYALAIIVAALFAAEISFLFGLPVLTLGSDYFGIATLGFTIIIKVLLDNSDTMLGFQEMKGARGMIGIPKITSWFWVFLALVIVVVVMRNILHSSYGRAIVSVREDDIAGKAMGIDVAEYKILSFVIGSLFAGLAGGLYAHINGFLHPNTFNFIKSFDPMIIIVLGGLGSMTGTLAASFAWVLLLEGVFRLIIPQGFEQWRYVVYPFILLLTMLLKPNGLFGDYEMVFLRQILPPLKAKLKRETYPAAAAKPGTSSTQEVAE